jgi:DNA damage-binding protein 1
MTEQFIRSDTHIVVSTPRETHLFRVDEDEERLWYMDPITVSGLITNQPTLALANVMQRVPGMSGASAYGDSSFVVQVTPVGISMLEMDLELGTTSFTGSLILEESTAWRGRRVVAASVNPSQVVIALDGGLIASFGLDEHGHLRLRQ